jgi:DNA polymerase-1
MKIALFHIHDDFAAREMQSRVLLQIHDELVIEVAPGEWDAAEQVVHQRMGDAAELSVPLEVQIGRGGDWNSAGH